MSLKKRTTFFALCLSSIFAIWRKHDIHLKGELPVEELDLDVNDELIRAEKPLRYDLSVEKLHDAVLVTGSLTLPLECECARCLKKFKTNAEIVAVGGPFAAGRRGQGGRGQRLCGLDSLYPGRYSARLSATSVVQTGLRGIEKQSRLRQTKPPKSRRPVVWAELDKLKLK